MVEDLAAAVASAEVAVVASAEAEAMPEAAEAAVQEAVADADKREKQNYIRLYREMSRIRTSAFFIFSISCISFPHNTAWMALLIMP